MNIADSLCARCTNGTEDKRCYSVGWNKCKGEKFVDKKLQEQYENEMRDKDALIVALCRR